jgi:cell division protein FtsB
MDEKLNTILSLENKIEKLQIKNNKYKETNSQIFQQYSTLRKQYLIMV